MNYPVRDGVVTVNDMRLHYIEAGPSEGAPLIFLHGIGGGIEDWWANLGYFGEQGYRVLAPSMPGHGSSDFPSGGWDAMDSGRTVVGLMDAWHVRQAPLIGHSAGGIPAMLATLEAPDRVSGLVLVAPSGLGRRIGWMLRVLTIPIIGEASWQPWLLQGKRAEKAIFADQELVNHEILERWVTRHRDPAQRRNFFRLLRQGLTIFGLKSRLDLRPRLHEIACPTLIIWGRDDQIVPQPDWSDSRLQEWRGMRLLELAPCGHWPQVEQSAAFDHETALFLRGLTTDGAPEVGSGRRESPGQDRPD